MVNLNTIKNWFKTGYKPTQQQFWDTWDSFFHKEDQIPISNIENLNNRFDEKADDESLTNHINDQNAHGIGDKVDKEPGKGLSTNDYTTPEKEKLASLSDSIMELLDRVDRPDPISVSGEQTYRLDWTDELKEKYSPYARPLAQVKVPGSDVWKPVLDYRVEYNEDGSTAYVEWDLDGLDTKIFTN